MILGVDASRVAGRRTGVGRDLQHLISAWNSTVDLPFERVRIFTPALIGDLPSSARVEERVLPGGGGIAWQVRRLRPAAQATDVLFSPYTIPPAYKGRSVVNNLGILEGRHALRDPRSRARSAHMAWSARRADAVIANSHSTKRDLVEHYGVEQDKITVVWPGVAPYFHPDLPAGRPAIENPAVRLLGARAPYLLFVGKLSDRRNVLPLVDAFAIARTRLPDLRLLVVGPNDRRVPLDERIRARGVDDVVRHVEYVDHATLAPLYRGARAFVLPTEQEGFSATILEALASGCPVITVDHPALHECGLVEVTLTLRDADVSRLASAIERIVEDDALRATLVARGLDASGRLSWDETARRMADVLARVARA